MQVLENDLLLRALNQKNTPRYPVWLMRQAGRFLVEYQKVREEAGSFKGLLENPEKAAEVTIQPVNILQVDAAIIFSDILVVPEAMGCHYVMEEKKGPLFPNPIHNFEDLKALHLPEVHQSNLKFTLEAIEITKHKLQNRVPLIGFCGAPWTIFAYCTEGSGSKTFSIAKRLLYQNPEFSHQFLQLITDSTILYLKAQIQKGADVLQIFDSWAGILSKEDFETWSLPYISQICKAIQEVPVIIFAKGANFSLEAISQLPCKAISLDWNIPIEFAVETTQKTTQGNLDPCLLYAPLHVLTQKTQEFLKKLPSHHIVNLGHGIYPDTPRENVIHFIQLIQKFSKNEQNF